jgi:hypothetical protein
MVKCVICVKYTHLGQCKMTVKAVRRRSAVKWFELSVISGNYRQRGLPILPRKKAICIKASRTYPQARGIIGIIGAVARIRGYL